MAVTQAYIDVLNEAIARGEKSVLHNGKQVVYRSVHELIRARDDMERQLAATEGRKRSRIYRIAPAGRGY